ncbi:uncharacterized protein LOC121727174 [Aricia agestis]|uniref:uncharacterized protein LOC121727174 n=1 Tax=Aricia agestis TaxID=91739 RepID=UPI001C203596|nr:uncharacterized protein LOC121727174 [Aricia agestis]
MTPSLKEMSRTILILYFCEICVSYNYTLDNSKGIFENFKLKYNKVYENNSVELEHFNIFVSNLNDIEKLNASETVTYTVNQFTDLDPAEVEERYAIHIKPYDITSNGTEDGKIQTQGTEQVTQTWNPSNLYNLDDSEQLFEEYLKKFKDKKYSKKFDRLKHYYRFVKTLVTINRERQEGSKYITRLDENADQLEEPLEYMY